MKSIKLRVTGELFAIAVAGFIIIVLPVALDPSARQYDAEILPVIRNAIEGLKPVSLVFLLLAGVMSGFIARSRPWQLGLASIVFFPLWSLLDLSLGGDHNLLPIEWIVYAILGLPVAIGAWGVSWLRRRAGHGKV